MTNSKKRKNKIRKYKKREKSIKIEPDQIILKARQILLYGVINESMANKVTKQLFTLDQLSHKPITLWINSGGGNVYDGFAIIDAMKGIKSPVATIIIGKACSMAGLISITGEARFMTKNAIWMAHDVATSNEDYVSKFLARAEHTKEIQKRTFAHLSKYTKLSQIDLSKARNQELWLYAEDCYKKGIIDKIIK